MAQPDLPHFLQFSEKDEVKQLTDTKVTGQIPKWLRGMLVRNGDGVFQIGETTLAHLFDGMAVLHKFWINDGQVKYQCRILDTETWKRCSKAQCIVDWQFGTLNVPDPCKLYFFRHFSYYFHQFVTDNTAVNVIAHGDRLIALTETPKVVTVDPSSLQRLETVDLSGIVTVKMSTAHPHFDSSGAMYNLGTNMAAKGAYKIIEIPPPAKNKGEGDQEDRKEPLLQAKVLTEIPSRWGSSVSYNHSFGMSAKHFVVLEQTLTVNSLKVLFAAFRRLSLEGSMEDKATCSNHFHVVDRETGKLIKIKYATPSFFCFHFINCFEDSNFLIVDLVGYDTPAIVRNLYVETLHHQMGNLDKDPPRFRRYVLPLDISKVNVDENLVTLPASKASAVKLEDGSIFLQPDFIFDITEDIRIELPRINSERCYGTKHRFVYGTTFHSLDSYLIKLDLEEKKFLKWKEAGMYTGEPVFVPSPDAKDEDDGVILSPMMSETKEHQDFLLVLDAKTFTELGRATVPPGAKIPVSFHGNFVDMLSENCE